MSEFKIIYYNCRGRSEVTRIILEFAGKSYEEEYVDDKWPEYKKKLTESGEIAFGQVPLLKHNGKNICQSCAILRYVGRLYGYYGDNDDDKWKIDMVVDGTYDLRSKLYDATIDNKNAEADTKVFNETILPTWLDYFAKLKKRNEGDFYVGKKVSIADVAVYDVLYECNVAAKGKVLENETLKKFMESFEKIPKYAEYRKSPRWHKE